ncbi:DEAD/DEAH box helicase [Corynebacterium glyciniphilum]|uniref:DEAD/DEAH box helicase n=1 Tax=Corynebacterium glyciniphilum TaxID=1404244 RepID=UPI003FD04BDE
MTEHQVHLLWLAGRGLHVWAEQVDGHVVVVDAASIGARDLPDPLREVMKSRPLRRRDGIRVATPKGRIRSLDLPTQAYTPDQALPVLGMLSRYVRSCVETGTVAEGSLVTVPIGLSPETLWLIRLYDLLLDAVHAGRVMMKMQFTDGQWYPTWCLSTSGAHNRVVRELQATAPAVLTLNGGPDALLRAADELVHWMCVRLLQDRIGVVGGVPENHFISSLFTGEADARANPVTAEALNTWRASARQASTKMVLSLEEPDSLRGTVSGGPGVGEPDRSEPRWRLEIRMSVDDGPAEPIPASEATESLRRSLREGLDQAYRAWPELRQFSSAVEAWLRTKVWFPPASALTGRPEKDRAVCLALTTDHVERLLVDGAKALAAGGTEVLVPRAWSVVRPEVRVKVTPVGQGPGSGKMGVEQLLSFDWAVSVDGEQLSASEMSALMTTASSLVEIQGRYVRLDTHSLGVARSYFAKLRDAEAGDDEGTAQLTLADLVDAELASAADGTPEAQAGDITVDADGWLAQMVRSFFPAPGEEGQRPAIAPPEIIEVPSSVRTQLRDHQRRGLNWLAWMYRHRIGAILADDMGLGKTLQVLSLLAWEREAGDCDGPTLVIAPTSVLDTWQSEVARHVPTLSVLVDHGGKKVAAAEFAEKAHVSDIVLTTYGTVGHNPDRYSDLVWGRVVVDEAQNIKNPGTVQSKAVRAIRAGHHLALTGTPVENRLAELHSILDFCNPGLLGSAQAFQNRLAIPIERYQDSELMDRLRRLVEPFILRRVKNDESMGLNLPEKREVIDTVPLTEEQAALYEAYTTSLEQRIVEAEGKGRSGIILGALVRIKQICNHPAHFSGDGSGLLRNGRHRSKKVERLFEIVEDALDRDRKVLVFTQFPSFGEMLVPELQRQFGALDDGVPVLHGGLSRSARSAIVDDFQSDSGPKVMILSTRAGGTGITLTRASVVVHIDRWWNPAVEDQATDRAYRIGQGRDVTVHKLVTTGTLDERINDILSSKRELAGDIVTSGEGWIASLDDHDLAELWQLNRSTVARETAGSDRAAPVVHHGERKGDNNG